MDTINVNGFQYFGVCMLYSLCSRNGGGGDGDGVLINCTSLSTKTI